MRIVAAMSGGIDSSVAATLLHEAGHDVIGLSMQLYDQTDSERQFGSCCTIDDLHDARRVAAHIGIPHYIVNFEKEFEEHVVSHFVQQYAVGRTPIPCVQCNSDLKFSHLLERARGLNANRVATGHYVRVTRSSNPDGRAVHRLYRAIDRDKDQSYFLFSLTQEQLAYAEFPLGKLQKSEVRSYARARGIDIADKPDSQEICFVPDGDYASLVERREPDVAKAGPIVDGFDRVLGNHSGIHRFTVGQRKGLGLSSAIPLYVTALDKSSGTVTVGPRDALEQSVLTASGVNWIECVPDAGTTVEAQIRHRQTSAAARVWPGEGDTLRLEFDDPQRAITPGQAVVVYSNDLVLGGGWID